MALSAFPDPAELKGAVQGTLFFLMMYGGFLIPLQSFSKLYIVSQKKREAKAKAAKDGNTPPLKGGLKSLYLSVKYYNTQDVLALAGDRSVGNVLEQALIFLPLYWLHALFVDPTQSFTIAAIYTISRAIYPFVYLVALNGHPSVIGVSTGPGYLVTVYLFYQIASKFLLS